MGGWPGDWLTLPAKGFAVKLVDARQVKNVSGRKTDVLDCQWIQQLHIGLWTNTA